MKMKTVVAGIFVAALATASVAEAQTTPVINHRQHNQVRRINQGVRSGELTHSEAHRLRTRERNIRTDKQIAKASGNMTPRERASLRRRESRLSRSVYRKKHNYRSY